MRIINITLFIIMFLVRTYADNKIIYTEPRNNAEYVNVSSNIIIGFEKKVNLTALEMNSNLTVKGKDEFNYGYTVRLAEDNTKLIIKPLVPFRYNDKVVLNIKDDLANALTGSRKELLYTFTTSKQAEFDVKAWLKKQYSIENLKLEKPPVLYISVYNKPASGHIFTGPWFNGNTHLMIQKNLGNNYWTNVNSYFSGDLKKQINGNLTFFEGSDEIFYEINKNYEIVDSYTCGNGYTTDIHDLQVLSNGHALLMSYDPQIVDMSKIVEGGDPNATVIGLIIQELDNDKEVVFQWRSWDHFQITDATYEDLTKSTIDYIHGNAIEQDHDGNLLISSRHIDEITKINRTTGDVMWHLGGKNNNFTFINDPIGFSHQHDIRRMKNGNITLYDNGNFHTPKFSRVVEYRLNETDMTAELVWQYRNKPDIFGPWGGNAQRLENGNTLISWGGAEQTLTEVTPAGKVVFEAKFAKGIYTYRSYKFEWDGTSIPEIEMPETYLLNQNFPNPFNPASKIKFTIGKADNMQNVKLIVYDLLGREITTLFNKDLVIGEYQVEFDGRNYPSGLYFYTLFVDNNIIETKKMVLLK